MKLIIRHKAKNDDELIKEVMQLDAMCYPTYMQGTYDTINARFKKNEDSFILAYHGEKLVGYLCFFPVTDSLFNKIYEDNKIYDTDILPEDIRVYGHGGLYNIFIISVVVHPDYQGSDVIKYIAENFVEKIEMLNNNSNIIGKILATAVSNKGKNFLEKLNFTNVRVLNKGYLLYDCLIENLDYTDK